MINWITNNLATAPKMEVDENIYKVIDVRDMVDKKGNSSRLILDKIESAVSLIKNKQKVVVCCDYGLSRSNAIAVGVLFKHYGYNFDKAVRTVINKTGQELIELGLLNSVRRAIGISSKKIDRKTVLITGASGFIGRALIDSLEEKYKLITPNQLEMDILKGSVELDLLVKKTGAGLIIHLANPKIYTTNRAMAEMILMLKNVLDVCRENKTSIIFPSSWVVFNGYKNRKIVANSFLSPNPSDTYGQAKFLCENLINQYKKSYGIKATIIRFSQIYGQGSDKPKFIFNFLEKAKKNLNIYAHKYKNGLPILDLLNIKDAVLAFEFVIRKNFFGIINIGSGFSLSTFDVAQKIKETTQSKSRIVLQEIDDCVPKIVMDIKEAKKFLGWSPKINFNNEVAEIIKYSKNYGIKKRKK